MNTFNAEKRSECIEFILTHRREIPVSKMAKKLSVSESFLTRLQIELGVREKKPPREHSKKEESQFFSFRDHYELFIGRN